MIDLVEIKNAARVTVGVIDTANSIIWHGIYFGVGDFEIYAQANEHNVSLLQEGYYITRPNNAEVGIIDDIKFSFNIFDGYMITATGRFAKSLLERRIIYKLSNNVNQSTILRGNVEIAARQLVKDNAIQCPFDSRRNIPVLGLAGLKNLPYTIVDENGNAAQKQVTYKNLLEYSNELLQEYGLSSRVIFNNSNKMLLYEVYEGTDRSMGNAAGNDAIVFSVDYDNLVSSDYEYSKSTLRNAALIGGSGEGIERFYTLLTENKTGLELREIFVDASSQHRKVKASNLQEAYPSGTFSGLNFVVGGVIYATLVPDTTSEYSLTTLQNKFPSGTVSGTKFVVGGVTYATAVYGKENTFVMTAIGYKALLDVDNKDGDYQYTASIYTQTLNQKGQEELKKHLLTETFTGEINASFGMWIYGRDYFLGDIVTVQDNKIGKYVNVRIAEVTEVQDENGYTVNVVFGE